MNRPGSVHSQQTWLSIVLQSRGLPAGLKRVQLDYEACNTVSVYLKEIRGMICGRRRHEMGDGGIIHQASTRLDIG